MYWMVGWMNGYIDLSDVNKSGEIKHRLQNIRIKRSFKNYSVKPFILNCTLKFIKLNWGQKTEQLSQDYIAHSWDTIPGLAMACCLSSADKYVQIYNQVQKTPPQLGCQVLMNIIWLSYKEARSLTIINIYQVHKDLFRWLTILLALLSLQKGRHV